ncbi:porin [Cupriavidus necator]|uniref:porin n=1 Tax=Cupriavidus necator TaxID=106590 RepID=UPI00339D985C
MKKQLAGFALIGGFAQMACAQSSVTLYGVVDEGMTYNNNAGGHHQFGLVSGVIQASRFGLRGTEELGGGMKALFVLENGFDASTGKLGQGGLMFGRQAYVGLSGNYGTVTMGRQYDSVVDFVGPLNVGAQWGGFYNAHPGDIDNLNNSSRVNHAIKYRSQDYGGFSFGGVYSLGGVAGSPARNQIWSLGAGYGSGPLRLGLGYLNVRNPNASFYGTGVTANTTGSAPLHTLTNIGSPVQSGYASARSQAVVAAGAAYNFGAATLGTTYSNTRFKDLGDLSSGPNPFGYRGTATFNNVEVSFKYQLTPALLLGVAADYARGSGINDASYRQFVLGADYNLSRRTDVYAMAIYQKASGIDSTGKRAVAAINGVRPSADDSQTVLRVGLRHKF